VTGVHGRTTGVWTLLSSMLCFLCAFNLRSKPLYAATFLSFLYAIAYLAMQCLLYHTIHFAQSHPLHLRRRLIKHISSSGHTSSLVFMTSD